MPAPVRPGPVNTFATAISAPKGIVGVYSDLEVDALISSITVGGGSVDLTNYYTKTEVDALVAGVDATTELALKADLTNTTQDVTLRRVKWKVSPTIDAFLSMSATGNRLVYDVTGSASRQVLLTGDLYSKIEIDSLLDKKADLFDFQDISANAFTLFSGSSTTGLNGQQQIQVTRTLKLTQAVSGRLVVNTAINGLSTNNTITYDTDLNPQWLPLLLNTAFTSASGKTPQYRILYGGQTIELRGSIAKKDATPFTIDTAVDLGSFPASTPGGPDLFGNVNLYGMCTTTSTTGPGLCHMRVEGSSATNLFVAIPMLRAPTQIHLDGMALHTFTTTPTRDGSEEEVTE
jgi:hypothetical protein